MNARTVWRWAASILLAIVAVVLVLAAILFFAPKAAAQDVVLEVQLNSIARVVVIGYEADSIVYVPPGPIFEMVGLAQPAEQWITPADLEDRLRVPVYLDRQQALIRIRDDYALLPATRRYREAQQVKAAARPSPLAFRGATGLFGTVGADEEGNAGVRLGYGIHRTSVTAGWSTTNGASWAVSISPLDQLHLGYSDAEQRPPALDGRLILGRSWLGISVINDDISASAAVTLPGQVIVFADTRERLVATWAGPGSLTTQLGHTGEVAAVALSFGAVRPSPFVPPLPGNF